MDIAAAIEAEAVPLPDLAPSLTGGALAEQEEPGRIGPDGSDFLAMMPRIMGEMMKTGTWYRRVRGLETAEGDAHRAAVIKRTPPEYMRWDELAELAQIDTEASFDAWAAMKEQAREDLESGHRAAVAVEGENVTPMDRARFLVLRESFREEWQPKGGIESALVDQLAQAHTLWLHWQKEVMRRTSSSATRDIRDRAEQKDHERCYRKWGEWTPPYQTEAEAIQQAADMADRYQRTYLRTLRQLRDLRRYSGPAAIVNNGGQVNVGQQQINTTGTVGAPS